VRAAGRLPVFCGLCVALGGPALLVSPPARALGDPEAIATRLLGQAALWSLLAALLWIVVRWECRPLASLGVRPWSWRSLAWGLGLVAFTTWIVNPLGLWLLRASGLPGFESGLAEVLRTPAWLRAMAVLGAGVVEETLYRGYAFSRLEEWTGRGAIAGVLSVGAFALVHVPLWGVGPSLTFVLSGGVATAFFAWRRDLLANVTAHVVQDALGLLVFTDPSVW
jgi:membrane protease YdiL (CAAX protease family)